MFENQGSLKILLLCFCLSALTSCGASVINERQQTQFLPQPGDDDQNPFPNLPDSQVDWDGQTLQGTKNLRVIPTE